MFNRDTLEDQIYFVLEKEVKDPVKADYLTDRICDAVSEWMPKHGDFWLDDEGVLRVNKGWGVVCAEAPEITEEENERRFREALKLIRGVTHEQLVDIIGEEGLEEFRKVTQ